MHSPQGSPSITNIDEGSQECGSQDVHYQLTVAESENAALAGTPSFEGLDYNMIPVSLGVNIFQTPSLQTNDEGQESFHGAFDIGGLKTLPSTSVATDCLFLPAPLAPEGLLAALQGAYITLDPPINFDAFSGVIPQMLQAQLPYTGDVDPMYDFGHRLVPPLEPREHIPNTIIGSFGSNRDIGEWVNMPDPMMGVNPRGACANPASYYGNATAQGGWMNASDVLARNGHNISMPCLRLRGTRSPPQAYEGDVSRLYDRLIREGADLGAALILRYIIFADGVTVDALMAPVRTPEMIGISNGATKMWGLLLEMKEVVPGKTKYRCLLCPLENRHEYRHNRDAVRHFNKDHFGFSFRCEYCNHEFFKFSEKKRHTKKCKRRPAAGV